MNVIDVDQCAYNLFPGTKMNSTQSATVANKKMLKTVSDLFMINLLIYGSRMTENLMKEYSLKPTSPVIGSRRYWCVAMQ